MSVESMAKALNIVDPRLTPIDRLVLVGIANHDGDGGAWPSKATLARYTGTTERTVRRALRTLEECGYLTTIINGGGLLETPNDRRPNRYTIHFDGGSSGAPPSNDGGASGAATGVPPTTATGVPAVPPEPSYEPSIEPSLKPPLAETANGVAERTPGQTAKSILDWYWQRVKDKTGKQPVGVTPKAFMAVITPFLVADWADTQIREALRTMYGAGVPLSKQSLERELTGRGRPGGRLSITEQTAHTIARHAAGLTPPLPEFGSRPIFPSTGRVPALPAPRQL